MLDVEQRKGQKELPVIVYNQPGNSCRSEQNVFEALLH